MPAAARQSERRPSAPMTRRASIRSPDLSEIATPASLDSTEIASSSIRVSEVIPGQSVTLRHVELHSEDVASVTYVDGEGKVEQALVYRDQEPQLELVQQSRPLSFAADGDMFRLVSEAQRLRFAFLFDPLIAVSTSGANVVPSKLTVRIMPPPV